MSEKVTRTDCKYYSESEGGCSKGDKWVCRGCEYFKAKKVQKCSGVRCPFTSVKVDECTLGEKCAYFSKPAPIKRFGVETIEVATSYETIGNVLKERLESMQDQGCEIQNIFESKTASGNQCFIVTYLYLVEE